jgi:anti-anti-sigma factor
VTSVAPRTNQALDPIGPPILVARIQTSPSHVVLKLSGDFIASSTVAFDAQIDQLFSSSFRLLVLDADEVETIDAVGVGRLVWLYNQVVRSDGQMSILCSKPAVSSALAHSALALVLF